MAKSKTQYVCQQCGAIHPKWAGKCENCGAWNSLNEQLTSTGVASVKSKSQPLTATKLSSIKPTSGSKRISTSLAEVDQVLGGGIVPASVSLIAGEPGIGKSTLILQIASYISDKQKVLYVSGEESAYQIKMRADRLGNKPGDLEIVTSTSVDDILATIASNDYGLVIIDSIQTMSTSLISSSPGSVSQITNSTQLLIATAKSTDTALLIVGHVTKQGNIAGPKLLEHLVDVVLNLEGDRYGGFKVLRGVKNRFGSTNEVGIFEMKDNGLNPVDNPSKALLAERQISDGSIVLATLEGSRPILVEVQALVSSTNFGYPKRTASGFDLNRLNLLIAMLERRTKLKLDSKDVYVNIVGGLQIADPAADLAVCMAIATAAKGFKLKQDYTVFGEVGLSGEVRHVRLADKRISESKKLGFAGSIGPKAKPTSSFVKEVGSVSEALNKFLET